MCSDGRIKTNQIYIPIWSYFYRDRAILEFFLSTFTFQYGATSTSGILQKKTLLSLFTFQYGATSTVAGKEELQVSSNLHSNMELLLPKLSFARVKWDT